MSRLLPIDVEVINDDLSASMDKECTLHFFHGPIPECFTADEVKNLSALISRQYIRLGYVECPDPKGMWKNLRVYRPEYALQQIISNPPCESVEEQMRKAEAEPGKLKEVGRTEDRNRLFGGYTGDKKAFVLVPYPFLDMYYRECLINLARSHRQGEDDDIHEMALYIIEQETFRGTTPFISEALEASRNVSYWIEQAGSTPIADRYDIRAQC